MLFGKPVEIVRDACVRARRTSPMPSRWPRRKAIWPPWTMLSKTRTPMMVSFGSGSEPGLRLMVALNSSSVTEDI